jgi:uncharacterized protein YggE
MISDIVYDHSVNGQNMLISTDTPNLIHVNGKAIVDAEPDIAMLNMGVVTENESAELATAQNKIAITSVIDGLLAAGINENDIKTSNYSIQPIYEYMNGQREFVGYEVTHDLEVKILDINTVGIILEDSIKNGINNQQNIIFTVSNYDVYYQEALALAVENAIMKANNIAFSIGGKLSEYPLNVTEKVIQVRSSEQLNYRGSGIPLQTGIIRISAMISATFAYIES